MKPKLILIIAAIVIFAVVAILVTWPREPALSVNPEPATFEECAARYPVMESYPRRCVSPSGAAFTETIAAPVSTGTGDANPPGIPDLITVTSPSKGQKVSSPLTVTGSARGTWYFEATFPVEIRDASGKILAQVPGQAQGDWMTENFVPFKATLSFPAQPAGSKGTLILHNDNPSDDPARDKSVSIPVTF